MGWGGGGTDGDTDVDDTMVTVWTFASLCTSMGGMKKTTVTV